MADDLLLSFAERFGGSPDFIVRSPGRVNLIGEHTDYSEGFVLPMAIDRELRIAVRRRGDRHIAMRSDTLGEEAEISLDGVCGSGAQGWGAYVEGVIRILQAVSWGMDGLIVSALPVGAGLSSSAALELAIARAMVELHGWRWEPESMAKVCQRAEAQYAGSRCGLMDQLSVALGVAGHALLIDCRSLRVENVRLPDDLAIVVCDSGVRRQLVYSGYNARREECEEAARLLGIPALRDATLAQLETAGLPDLLYRRAKHVVEENDRVLPAVAALKSHDPAGVGRLMLASHASLRDLFEVSCLELDALVEQAMNITGCFGSRLTGAGFGGCTVSLVRREHAETFTATLAERYQRITGLHPSTHICRAVDGVSVE